MSAAGGHLQELGRPRRLHLVGIGGAGMSGIATILATMGHTVTGSDRRDSPTVQRLRGHGITVAVGHDATLVASAELVGASSAVPPSNPELVEARRLGIPVLWRVELLAALCALRRTLAVAGTKGKSTTTAMLAHILEVAGERPSFLVGGDLPGVDGGARWVGDSPWFVVEADESDGTFLALPTEAVVVTNVEADHLDQYGSMAALREAFTTFAGGASGPRIVGADSPDALVVARELEAAGGAGGGGGVEGGGADRGGAGGGTYGAARGGSGAAPDEDAEETGVPASFRVALALAARARHDHRAAPGASHRAGPPVVTFGTAPGADIGATVVATTRTGVTFELRPGPLVPGAGQGERWRVELPVPGLHNVRNACGALALATLVGIPLEVGVAALASYRPVGRRFEWRGERAGAGFVDDYAHVPSAVATTLATARAGGWERVVAVFQPHLYSRTEALGAELGRALAAADVVVVTDVYAAREAPRPGVDGRLVADAARAARPALEVHYVPERAALATAVRSLLRPGDLCLTLGAGDVTTLADEIQAAEVPR